MAEIGFIGLGNMGAPMAANLLAAGHQVRVFDLVQERMSQLASQGAQAADSPQDAVQGVDCCISMLPASAHVRSLYLEASHGPALMHEIAPGTLVIECSTIAPETAREVAAAAAARGIDMLDAPVSGGTAGAESGTLTFIVGGDEATLARAMPWLEAMGAKVFHAGASGAGQVGKICNNMMLAILMAGTCEVLALGEANGLDPERLSNIMRESSGGNWALEKYNPWPGVMQGTPASRDYSGGFLVDLMVKDLGLAMEASAATGKGVPMGSLALSLYRLHREQFEAGGMDFSSLLKIFR